MRRSRFDEAAEHGGAKSEEDRDYDNDPFTCPGCSARTTRKAMSTYGARCFGCYASFVAAAFRGSECLGSSDDKARMRPAQYAASRLRRIMAEAGPLTLAQNDFLRDFEASESLSTGAAA